MAAERYRPNMLLWILVCFSGCFFICGESTPVTTQSTVTYDSPLQVSDVTYSDQMSSQSANTDTSTESVSIGNADYGTSPSAIRPADVSTVSAAMPTSTSENSFPSDSTASPGFKWTATTIAFGTGCLILIIVVAIGTFFVCRMKRRLRRYKVINYTTNQRPMTYDDPYNINDDINTMVGDEHSNGNTVVLTTMRKIETSPPPTLGPAPKPPVPVARRPAPPTPSSPSTPKETMETKTLFDKVADATIKGHSKETSKTTSSEEPGKDKTTAKKATAGAQISGAAVSEGQDNKKHPPPQAIQKLQKIPSGDSEDGLYETFDNSIKHLRRDMSYMSDIGQDALANGTYEEPLSRGLSASGLPSVDVNPDDMYEPIDGDMVSKIRRQSEELNFQRQMSGLPDTPEVDETEDGSSMTEYAAGISIAAGRVDSSGQKTGMPDQAMSPLGLHSIPLNNTIDERDENYDGDDDDDDDEEQHVYDDFDLDEVVHAEPVNVHETNAQIQMTENATQADQVLTEENVNRDEEDQELYDDMEIRLVEEKSVLAMKQDPKKRLQKLLAVDYSNEEDEDEEEELGPRETFTSESMLSVNYSRSNEIEVDVQEEKGEDEEPDLYENVTLKDTMVIDYSKLNEEEETEVEDDDVGSIISQRSSLTDSLQQPESSFPPLPSTPAPSFTFTSPPSLHDLSPPISSPPSPPIHSHPSTQNVSHMPPFSQNTPTDLKDTPLDIQVTPSDLPDTPPPRLPLLPPPMLISHGSADSSPTTVPPEPQFPPPPPPPNLLAGSPDMLNFSLNEKTLLPSGETHSTESLPKRAPMQSLLTPNAYDDSNLPAVPSRRDVPIKARSSSGNPTLSLDDINQPLPLMKGLASSLEAMESATYFVDKEDLQQEMFEQNHPLSVPRQSVTRMPTVARNVPLNDSESLLPQTNNNQADASKAKVNQQTNVIHQKRMPGSDDVTNSGGGMPTSQRPLSDTHQQKVRSSSSISEWVAFDDDSGAAGSHGNDSDDNVYENITLEQNK